jgi:hypothetical protein
MAQIFSPIKHSTSAGRAYTIHCIYTPAAKETKGMKTM